jgi:hypothetical protein
METTQISYMETVLVIGLHHRSTQKAVLYLFPRVLVLEPSSGQSYCTHHHWLSTECVNVNKYTVITYIRQ